MDVKEQLASVERELRGIDSSVFQSFSWQKTVVGKLAGTTAGVGLATAVTNSIAVFGAASTGTAISTLSGAAAKSATMYFIGSTVGLGAVAGGVMLSGAGIAAGVAAAVYVPRALIGSPLSDKGGGSVVQALASCQMMAGAIDAELKRGTEPSRDEIRVLLSEGLKPFLKLLDEPVETPADKGKGADSRTIAELLKPERRRRFLAHQQSLKELAGDLEAGCRK